MRLFLKGIDTRDGVLVRMLAPKGGGFGEGPTSIGERKECQRPTIRTLAPKGGGFGENPTSIGEKKELQRGFSEGPTSIGERKELQQLKRGRWVPKEVDLLDFSY